MIKWKTSGNQISLWYMPNVHNQYICKHFRFDMNLWEQTTLHFWIITFEGFAPDSLHVTTMVPSMTFHVQLQLHNHIVETSLNFKVSECFERTSRERKFVHFNENRSLTYKIFHFLCFNVSHFHSYFCAFCVAILKFSQLFTIKKYDF